MLLTKRCYLRPFNLEDLDNLIRLHSHPEVMRDIFGGPRDPEHIKQDLTFDLYHEATYGFSKWAVFLQRGDIFIGRAGFVVWDKTGEAEVGYKFFPEYWGKGYATEVLQALLQWGQSHITFPIVAFTYENHQPSIHVMQKAGMHFLRHDTYEDHDVVVYGL